MENSQQLVCQSNVFTISIYQQQQQKKQKQKKILRFTKSLSNLEGML